MLLNLNSETTKVHDVDGDRKNLSRFFLTQECYKGLMITCKTPKSSRVMTTRSEPVLYFSAEKKYNRVLINSFFPVILSRRWMGERVRERANESGDGI